MHPVGFEPTVSAGERPQTYALDRAATGTGMKIKFYFINYLNDCNKLRHDNFSYNAFNMYSVM